jgi:hypothetical protein
MHGRKTVRNKTSAKQKEKELHENNSLLNTDQPF